MYDWGFPARLNPLPGVADALTHIRAEEEEDPTLAGLGKRWIYSFLNRNPDLAAKYGTQLGRQRAYARATFAPSEATTIASC